MPKPLRFIVAVVLGFAAGSAVNMGLILLIVLILLLIGSLPTWPYSRGWGYSGPSILGVLLVIFLVLLLFRVVAW